MLSALDVAKYLLFKIPGEKQSRIVGYFDNENVFNIVAYDYKHSIYKRN